MAAVVAVVTDSTACLPAGLAARCGIIVVPLRIVAAGLAADDDPAAFSGVLGGKELGGGARLSTASPAPERFAAAYVAAAKAGAGAVLSVHVSASLSGTVNSAALAASAAPVPVRVVDSRSLGMGLGFAALAAAEAATAGAGLDAVAGAAIDRARALGSFFVLDTLDELRAGGRLPPERPAAGARLTARPLLHLADGRVAVLEKLRTPSAAVRRLEEVAAEFAGGRPVDVAVQYLGPPERGEALARRLEQLIPCARHRYLTEAGPVIRAHTGPGMLGAVVAPY